ncbi:MAG: NAD(P)-dependent oxidoreductase [Anaerolineae bacterium]|nr:NAD(P)-dependent oxidoreductase [Candidatus Roseilinea sp.]MDW8450598.1 NAD(P)-dependent oxidoreductase [Anaerolineae bacterium]
MKVAVTGGNGRFGRVVIAHLIRSGYDVVNIDRTPPEGASANRPNAGAFISLDLADLPALTRALEGCDAVIHLAAIPSPMHVPEPDVYVNNTVTSYNVLFAAADLGIEKVCLASSINAIGGAYSRKARYDYFPVDERHPTYNEDAYSLSKWVMEQQADSFARRHERMTIASLRLHGLHKLAARRTLEDINQLDPVVRLRVANHLWAYTDIDAAARACIAALHATYTGHEVFFIVAPTTIFTPDIHSAELAQQFYPDVPIVGDLSGNAGFYNCAKAERLLGWRHGDD